MNRHLRKIKNGLWDIFQGFVLVAVVILCSALAITPIAMAFELHWAWILLYVPVVILWAYIMGDE